MYRVFCFLINPVLLLVEARLFSYSVAKRAPSTDPASVEARLFSYSVAKWAPSTDPASVGHDCPAKIDAWRRASPTPG
jgi:hypothetical protein